MKSVRNIILSGIAFVHLSLVTFGATLGSSSPESVPKGWLGLFYDIYGGISGASSSYGFFSEPVGFDIRAKFSIVDRQGKETEVSIGSGSNHEVEIRMLGIMGEFMKSRGPSVLGNSTDSASIDSASDDTLRFQRALAASLSGSILAKHPEAKQVLVKLDQVTPPTIEEYLKGQRNAHWRAIYEFKFKRATEES